MGKLFGTFGIRGVANQEFTPKLAFDLGLALATHLKNKGKVAVGYDNRTSSEMLEHAFAAGLTAGGCDVVRLGMVPTPVLSFGIRRFSCDAGIMITASHNPPEYNGAKFWDHEGAGFVRDREREIERLVKEGGKLVSWDRIGKTSKADALNPYMRSLRERVPRVRRKLKVVVDCANGAGSVVTPQVLTRLGCKVVSMNAQLDGTFPGRLPEPVPEHLGELVKTVSATSADLGIAHDGDADRTLVVDERGELLSGDRVFALVAMHYLRGKRAPRIVTTVATSSVLDDAVGKSGGKVVRTRVGEPEIIAEFRENGGDLGGEENGGVIFPDWLLCRDGIMTAVQFVELVAQSGKSVSKVNSKLPTYHQLKRRVKCPDKLKQKVLDDLAKRLARYKPDRTEGLRVVTKDGWFIVRPSGTEPVFRCFSEARSEERAEELAELGMKALKESVKAVKG
jgi:phosphomannomutase/phosphoglucomutase